MSSASFFPGADVVLHIVSSVATGGNLYSAGGFTSWM